MDRLLPTKLAIPRPSREPIRRDRVAELLSLGLHARLMLLSAPPGFGKSTALVDWLADVGVRTSWVSLDDADNDPVRFLRYLWAAVARVPIAGERGGDGNAFGDAAEVVGELAALLAETAEPTIIVLDDYHLITAPAVQRAVGLLLECLPPQAHLVISTRVDPALPLARLRARGELVELRAGELRFTTDEARAFLRDRMGLELADQDLEALAARTEGWPAVLQLAGLSLAGRPDAARRVRDFAASHRFVLDYITDEVLARLGSGEREFLLRTSVLDRLTGPLCDALTGAGDGQEMLEQLERANVLLVPLDEERRWYRYHRLFAELLRARLLSRDPSEVRGLDLKAAAWYEEHGFLAEAIEHALRSGDTERARALVARLGDEFMHAGEFETVRGWIRRLPGSAVRSDAWLSILDAWAAVLAGSTEGVEERLADAEKADAGPGDPHLPTAMLPVNIALIRSVLARLSRDLPAAIRYAREGVDLLPADARLTRADPRGLLGHALLESGDLAGAAQAYRAALPASRAAHHWVAVARITRNLAQIEAREGHLRTAIETCDAGLTDLVGDDGAEMPAAAALYVARAAIFERMGDSGSAAAAADRAVSLALRGGDPATLREARELLARSRVAAPRAAAGMVEPLTEREREVLRLVGQGRSNRQIAGELFVTLGTVKAHLHNICGKLGAANRVEALARGRELGLLD